MYAVYLVNGKMSCKWFILHTLLKSYIWKFQERSTNHTSWVCNFLFVVFVLIFFLKLPPMRFNYVKIHWKQLDDFFITSMPSRIWHTSWINQILKPV